MTRSTTAPENQEAPSNLHGQKMDFLRAMRADRALSGDAKTVGAVLLDHYNAQEGMARPGQSHITVAAGITTRTTTRALKALQDGGWFTVSPRYKGGKQLANGYEPDWSRGIGLGEIRQEREKAPARNVRPKAVPVPAVAPVVEIEAPTPVPGHRLPNGLTIDAGLHATIVSRLGGVANGFLMHLNRKSAQWSLTKPEDVRHKVYQLLEDWVTAEADPAF